MKTEDYLGLAPREYSSRGKQRMGGTSKPGTKKNSASRHGVGSLSALHSPRRGAYGGKS
jgi:transposase